MVLNAPTKARLIACALGGFTLIGVSLAYSQEPDAATELNPPPAEAKYAIPTRADRIGQLVAPVMINGQGPYQFMLDTGATRSLITTELLTRMGLAIGDSPKVRVHGVTRTMLAPVVTLSLLQSGDVQLHDLRAPVLSGRVLYGVDGILGMDALADKKITADFLRDRLEIVDSQNQRADSRFSVVHFELLWQRLMVVKARLGGIPIKAVIDTGGSHTLGNPALLRALLKLRRVSRVFATEVIDVTDNSQSSRILFVPRVDLGTAELSNVQVTFSDFQIFHLWKLDDQPALMIGMDVLGVFGELEIDYPRKELRFRLK